MKKLFGLMVAMLFMAQMVAAQGAIINTGGIYVSSMTGEENTTFQTMSRNVRLWSGSIPLILFDVAELTTIPAGAPCTLYIYKSADVTSSVYNENSIEVYPMKGTWPCLALDVDTDNKTGAASYNYRSYPNGKWDSTRTTSTVMNAIGRRNLALMNSGPDLATPAALALEGRFVDSLRTGRCGGVMLRGATPGALFWLNHVGHMIAWGEVAIEKSKAVAGTVSLSVSPNPSRGTVNLSAGLRLTDKAAALSIYSLDGKKVADFSNDLKAGKVADLKWNPEKLPSGVYIAKLLTGRVTLVKRITLMK